jgi:hypothetical protein
LTTDYWRKKSRKLLKNQALRRFLKIVLDSPTPDVLSSGRLRTEPKIRLHTGALTGRSDGMRNVAAHEWAIEHKDDYRLRCQALEIATNALTPREVLAFVLFTPQQRYEVAVREWKRWMQGEMPKGNMWRTRTRWLQAMPVNPYLIWKPMRESFADYVEDLSKCVNGLGLAKAPFFACLMYPQAIGAPVCLDVHMIRWLGYPGAGHAYEQLTKRRYREGQKLIDEYAQKADMRNFAYQWAVWDYVRTARPHEGTHGRGFTVKSTEIALDLMPDRR